MNRNSLFALVLLAAIGGGLIAVGTYSMLKKDDGFDKKYNSIEERQEIALTNNNYKPNTITAVPDGLNFVEAADRATKSVVHIRSKYDNTTAYNGLFQYRNFSPSSQGSGVIISDDGYIATNNHVVEEANTVEVTMWNNRKYEARVIGTDPTTDLALIKIDEEDLEFLRYGDSDQIRVGEWVIACGNPFDLYSTVTAGIVSAKARNIGILAVENGLDIESFIQTDAAVNPGNSGGALVDLNGNLIGINTAIASRNGSFEGYSFAVPVTLVKKVMDDLLEFGMVQRGLLGIRIQDVSEVNEEFGLDMFNGVYIGQVTDNSAAEEAGLEDGDVIVGINDRQVDNVSQLQEFVARYRPGDEISVKYIRAGKEKETVAKLKNPGGNREIVVRAEDEDILGATFEDISSSEKDQLGIEGGVKVLEVNSGIWADIGIEEGFVITEIDKTQISNVPDLKRVLNNKRGERVIILGYTPDGAKSYYSIDWR